MKKKERHIQSLSAGIKDMMTKNLYLSFKPIWQVKKAFLSIFLTQFILAIFYATWVKNVQLQGNSLQEISLFLAIFNASIAIVQYPSGWIADKYGRKFTAILGMLSITVGLGFLIYSNIKYIGYVSLSLVGVGSAFYVGAADAWFRKIIVDKNDDDIAFFSNQEIVKRVAVITGAYAGTIFTTINTSYPWYLTTAAGLVSIVVALLVPADNRNSREECLTNSNADSFTDSSLRTQSTGISISLVISAILGIEFGVRNIIVAPYIVDVLSNGDNIAMGHIVFSTAIAGLFGNLFFRMISNKISHYSLVIISLLTFGSAQLLAGKYQCYPLFFISFCAGIFTNGWFYPLKGKIFNSFLREENRATLISIESMIYNISSSLTLLFMSYFIDERNISSWWFLGGGALYLSSLIYFYLFSKSPNFDLAPESQKIQLNK